MKRTALVRRTPLRRRRSRLAFRGRKSKRERSDLNRCRERVRERSGGRCEGAHFVRWDDTQPPWRCPRGAISMHHVWPEDRAKGVHDPDRCLDVCFDCHGWTHDNPQSAARWGMLRPSGPVAWELWQDGES